MGRIAYSQLNSLPDALSMTEFEMLFGSIPLAGQALDLTLKMQTCNIPGFSNEAWDWAVHGHVKRFRGRKMYSRQLSVGFTEDSLLNTYRKLKLWDEFIAGTESGSSQGFQAEYSVNSLLRIYNTIGDVAGSVVFENMFIQELSDISLDGQSSGNMQVQATFSFDRMLVGGVPVL